MKKIITLLALLAIAFTGFWYYGASKAKEIINQKLGEATKYFNDQGYDLKTEGLAIGGFPFSYEAKIPYPQLNKKVDNKDPSQEFESVVLDGFLSLRSNLIGSDFVVKKEGEVHYRFKEANQDKLDEVISSGELAATFNLKRNSYLDSIKAPFKTFFQHFDDGQENLFAQKSGSFLAKNLKVVKQSNPSINLFELQNGDIRYTLNEKDGNINSIVIKGDIKDLDLDTFIVGSDAYMPGHERSLKEIALLMSLPKPGKTSISFDLELTAPFKKLENLSKMESLDDLPPVNFNLKRADITNNFGHYFQKGQLSFQDIKNGKQFHYDHLATSETSKEQFELFKKAWEDFLSNLPICEESANPDQNGNNACNLVKALIPKLDEFGKISFQIDTNLDIETINGLPSSGKLIVNQLNYLSSIYGLKSDGLLDVKGILDLNPNLSYKIELLNYQSFLQDLFAYLKKVEQILPLLSPKATKLPELSLNHLTMVTDYLKAISDEPKADLKDIIITIKGRLPNEIIVGTLPQVEFFKLTNELFDKLVNLKKLEKEQTAPEESKDNSKIEEPKIEPKTKEKEEGEK